MITNLVATVSMILSVETTTNFSTHEQWNSWKFGTRQNIFAPYKNEDFIDHVVDESPKWRDEIMTGRIFTVYDFGEIGSLTNSKTVFILTNHFETKWIQTK